MTDSANVNEFCHYATYAELDFLRACAAKLPAGVQVVMLGAGPGVMAMAVREGNLAVRLLVIDHDTTEWVEKHMHAAGLDGGVIFFRGDSADVGHTWTEVGQIWGEPLVDLLIIDADHSYEGVKRDCAAWLPHLAPGGYVFFHDYDASETEFAGQEQYPGVRQAVEELITGSGDSYPEGKVWLPVAMPGTALVFQKAPWTAVLGSSLEQWGHP